MRSFTKIMLMSAASLTIAGSADAALYDFRLSGLGATNYQAHFFIQSSPTASADPNAPSSLDTSADNGPSSGGFQIDNVFNYTIDPSATHVYSSADVTNYPNSSTTAANIIFYSLDGQLGGLEIDSPYLGGGTLLVTDGEQLYTGPSATPTFRLGNFALVDSFNGPGAYLLTISQAYVPPTQNSAVPEPSTWALAILGFGAIGCAMRRSNRKVSVRFAA